MKAIRIVITLGIILWTNGLLWGQTPFDNAIKAYQEGQYAEARDLFLGLEGAGYHGASLYYNLGNTYYALNDLGRSTLYFERAIKLEPHNLVLRQNLDVVKTKCSDDFLLIPDFFAWRWIKAFSLKMSPAAWMWCSVSLAWVMVIMVMAFWWQKITRKWLMAAVSGLGLIWILVTAFGLVRHYLQEHRHEGIIIPQEVILRAAPDAQSAELLKLHAGLKVTLLDTLNRWHKVELPNKETGWLNPEEVIKI